MTSGDEKDQYIQKLERRLAITELILRNGCGFVRSPEDGISFSFNKEAVERIVFKSFYKFVSMKLSDSQWGLIKTKWAKVMEDASNQDWDYSMETFYASILTISKSVCGMSFLIVFQSSRLHPELEFFVVNVNDEGINREDVRDAFWEKYHQRFERNEWSIRNIYFSFLPDDLVERLGELSEHPENNFQRFGEQLPDEREADLLDYDDEATIMIEDLDDYLRQAPLQLHLIPVYESESEEEDEDDDD